jgi:hypothetical protein
MSVGVRPILLHKGEKVSVRVTATSGDITTVDNGDKWVHVDGPAGPRVDVIKEGNASANPPTVDKVVASFAPGHWDNVKFVSKEDRSALLDEAKELIGDVDDGNFGHQSTEWQNRAEAFLANVPH